METKVSINESIDLPILSQNEVQQANLLIPPIVNGKAQIDCFSAISMINR